MFVIRTNMAAQRKKNPQHLRQNNPPINVTTIEIALLCLFVKKNFPRATPCAFGLEKKKILSMFLLAKPGLHPQCVQISTFFDGGQKVLPDHFSKNSESKHFFGSFQNVAFYQRDNSHVRSVSRLLTKKITPKT